MLILKIGNIYVDILGDLPSKKWDELEKVLSFRPEGYQFSSMFNRYVYNEKGVAVRRMWDGWKRQFWKNKKRTYFPTGLLSIVKQFLNDNYIDFQIQDARVKPYPNIDIERSDEFVYRDYQEDVINKACNKGRGIISAATGSGKTAIGAGIIAKLGVSPFLFFVTSIDLLTQAKESLERILKLNGRTLEVGQIGAGIIDIKDINVCTIQTVVRALGKAWNNHYKFDDDDQDDKTPINKQYKRDIIDLIRSAKGSLCDEVHHWKANVCQLVARELKSCYYTYGMSATPYRDSGDDMLIQACFGKKIAEISASQLIRDSWLMKPDIKMVHIRKKKSIFKQWQSLYRDQVVENDYYNGIVANIANAYIDMGRLVLVLIKYIKHGQTLASMIPGSLFLSGENTKKARECGIQRLRDKHISCIISTSLFDEGIDIRALDTVILAGQGRSKTRAMQRIGRIIRTFDEGNKTKATAIDFCIHQKYLEKHAIAREKMYRTEPEFSVEDIDPLF